MWKLGLDFFWDYIGRLDLTIPTLLKFCWKLQIVQFVRSRVFAKSIWQNTKVAKYYPAIAKWALLPLVQKPSKLLLAGCHFSNNWWQTQFPFSWRELGCCQILFAIFFGKLGRGWYAPIPQKTGISRFYTRKGNFLDNHLQEAGPSIISFARGRSLRVIICDHEKGMKSAFLRPFTMR